MTLSPDSTPVSIPLQGGAVALVDAADAPAVLAAGPWFLNPRPSTSYASRTCRRPDGGWTMQRLHTFLTGWPMVDHANGDGLDNRRVNLRAATKGQNAANQRLQKRSTSGYKGVIQRRNVWEARVGIPGADRQQYLGRFPTAELAARAYDAAARELYGEFARLNFPEKLSA